MVHVFRTVTSVNETTTEDESVAGAGAAGLRRVRDPGNLLAVATPVAAGLSVVSLWWALPTVITAFLAGRRPGRIRPTALVLVAVLAAGVVAVSMVPSWLALGSQFVGVVVLAAMLPWFVGRFWRQYQELIRAGWERAEHLEREQRLVAEQARLLERARIAQDMHDVLGHDLSLIALSAGALKLAPGLADHHRLAAQDIRAKAAAAVERLGEVIGVLREETDGAPMRPSDSSLTRLVGEASASGLAVELRVDGEGAGLPSVVERATHRVVQEALTNVAKHAPHAATTVHVSHAATETRVLVKNGPASAAAGSRPWSGGRGLIGLDERVRLAGGSFEYGSRGGGFAVVARLPHMPPAQPPRPAAPTPHRQGGELPQEYRHARRRAGRTLVTAVMLPLVTGAVLSGALMGWETLSASRSVLDPRDYARLRVGQDRSEVERVLPDRQTIHRPSATEPKGRGITCEYYAMTADRFDDRSGDAYRLCFQRNMLVSLDALTP
ncbi:sensor histidine kinase [Streptomyces pseudovenezuelae]|uniref:histidine kinase n=1 Tax=Streptomyces pseudovenezuelae TaxID=67350 RepID=A0ABT6M413_9ACTN|nr:histidine kinase [Streptomyces pseudovenezuelae]MDH6222865.1 signal transduction histidine kinase [Streptomyces pseudovenezuelae]